MKKLFIQNRKTVIYLIFITTLQVLCTSSVIALLLAQHTDLEQFTLLKWLVLYLVFAMFMAFSLLPNSFIAFLGGFFLNFWAILFFCLSYIIALTIGFFIAKIIDNQNFNQSLQEYPKIKIMLEKLQKDEILLVFFARFSPIFPFALMNQLLFSMQVSFKTFIWASMLGMFPRMLLMTYFGSQAANLLHYESSTTEKTLQVIFLLITVVGVLYLFKKVERQLKGN